MSRSPAVQMESSMRPTTERSGRQGGLAASRGPRRLILQGATTGVALFFAAAMFGASWWNSNSHRSGLSSDAGNFPGAGFLVRCDPTHLWTSEPFQELVRSSSQQWVAGDFNDFRRFLERRHLENLRYGVTYRGLQVNGRYSEITYIRRPYDDPRYFQELLDVLSGAGEEPDRFTDQQNLPVHIIPESLLDSEASSMLAEMRRIIDDNDFPLPPA
jgi:hypothetical protein